VIKQDTSEKRVKIVYLSVGSNLGNRFLNIEKAKYLLTEKGVTIIESSRYYETLSWPNPKNPKFYNIMLKTQTKHSYLDVLNICKQIEKTLGRKKTKRNSPRECDIDIVDYNKVIKQKNINLPHPRMHTRNFVLIPLYEIDRNWTHPITKEHIKSLIFSLPRRDITSIKQI
jgi:2-amino-4-hydroxy-6-hydroxymethyldihydropteridine diphosphokinase